ncbi:MAG: hypothetical protein M0Z54_09405 [Thermaerobacter sp.]|nr:hypothetical protein [Thermaerobacter sp.]
MDVADKIADVILSDPSVSVREIAQRLGYAEEKTIYYWMNKRGFHGIRPFKRAVLTGQYRAASRAREAVGRPGRLPVADRLTKTGDPVYTGETLPITLDRGRGLFVWCYHGPPDLGILPGDYLVIGPVNLESAAVVLAIGPEHAPTIRHVVHADGGPLLVEPLRATIDSSARAIGTVLQVLRLLPPATI